MNHPPRQEFVWETARWIPCQDEHIWSPHGGLPRISNVFIGAAGDVTRGTAAQRNFDS
jgi:hypothetical protein